MKIAGEEAEPNPRLSSMRNMVNPTHRQVLQNIGRRQAIRKERCWWSGQRMVEKANAEL